MMESPNETPEAAAFFDDGFPEQVFGFAHARTRSYDEAEDLTQEILLEVLQSLSRLPVVENRDAWLWRIVHNTYYHWVNRRVREREAMAVCRREGGAACELDADPLVAAEEEMLLRREVAFLSARHRTVVTQHYFHGQSCAEIAATCGIPLGTVTWLLSDGREQIKKGMTMKRAFGQKSHSPERLGFAINGSIGKEGLPHSLLKGALAQNICLEAYARPVTCEALANSLGVAAAYVEDEVKRLVQGELLREEGNDRVQTSFFISDGAFRQLVLELAEREVESLAPHFRELLNVIHAEFDAGAVTSQTIPWNRWAWILPIIIHWDLTHTNSEPSPADRRPRRRDGGRWIGMGEHLSGASPSKKFDQYYLKGPMNSGYEAPDLRCCSVCTFWTPLQMTSWSFSREMVNFCETLLVDGGCAVDTIGADDEYLYTEALEKGIAVRKGEHIELAITALRSTERERLNAIIQEHSAPFHESISTFNKQLAQKMHEITPKGVCDETAFSVLSKSWHGSIIPFLYRWMVAEGELALPGLSTAEEICWDELTPEEYSCGLVTPTMYIVVPDRG